MKFSSRFLTPELILLFAMILVTALKLMLAATVGLGDDEAYYWDWSKRLQWNYFDHPGMTAWFIRLGTGAWGDNPFGVRFFAVIFQLVGALLLWQLGKEMFSAPTALLAVAFYSFAPLFSVGGFMMVPDAPLMLAWLAAALAAWKILGEGIDSPSMWLALGGLMGVGFLSKYTMLLLGLSLVILVAVTPEWRRYFSSPRLWSAVLIASLFCVPVLMGAAQSPWLSFKYHLFDRHSGAEISWPRWGQFISTQFLALGFPLFILFLVTWWCAVRSWKDRRWRFLFCLTFPTFALFSTQALFSEFKMHWTAPAYSLLCIGGAEVILNSRWATADSWNRQFRHLSLAVIGFFIIPINVLFFSGIFAPVLPAIVTPIAKLVEPDFVWDPKFDPTNDFYGWKEVADRIGEMRSGYVRAGEPEPFISSWRYQLVAQLAFATRERVWRVSPGRDQYRFWQSETDMRNLQGRSSIFIADSRFARDPRGDGVFEACARLAPLEVRRGHELARTFDFWFCKGFLGRVDPSINLN